MAGDDERGEKYIIWIFYLNTCFQFPRDQDTY